jgi:hypothetical protein
MNKNIKVYKQAMGYLTRAEGMETISVPRKSGTVEIEIVDAVKRIHKDHMLPEYVGNYIDFYI